MKTLTKKRGIFAAAAVLLAVTVMLVTTWCSNDIGNNETDDFTPPPGKGAVRLNFNEKIARTILPDNATIAIFDEFEFQFTPKPVGSTFNITVPKAKLNNAIILDPGTYDLIVVAKIEDVANIMQPAATNAEAVQVIITAAKTATATIVLKPYDPTSGTGDGTFKYNITDASSGAITSAVMNLTEISSSSPDYTRDIFDEAELDGNDYTLSVTAGYYYVDFVIEVDSGDEVTFRQIALITQNLTSSYAFTINVNYFYSVLSTSGITYGNITDLIPILSTDGGTTPLTEGAIVNVTQGTNTTTITLKNTSDFDNYEFYLGDELLVSDSAYTVNATTDHLFFIKKTYQLTIVGITSDGEYSSFIYIKVQ